MAARLIGHSALPRRRKIPFRGLQNRRACPEPAEGSRVRVLPPCQILDNGKGLSGTTAAGADFVSGRDRKRESIVNPLRVP